MSYRAKLSLSNKCTKIGDGDCALTYQRDCRKRNRPLILFDNSLNSPHIFNYKTEEAIHFQPKNNNTQLWTYLGRTAPKEQLNIELFSTRHTKSLLLNWICRIGGRWWHIMTNHERPFILLRTPNRHTYNSSREGGGVGGGGHWTLQGGYFIWGRYLIEINWGVQR